MRKPNLGSARSRWLNEAVPASVPIDVARVIRRRLPLIESFARPGIRIDLDASLDAGMVLLSEGDFDRILLNLVRNAVDAMPHGGQLRIVLRRRANRLRTPSTGRVGTKAKTRRSNSNVSSAKRLDRRPGRLSLRFYDTGEGIAADFLPHVFEAGVSGKSSEGGSEVHGYGLSSVRELVECVEGKVRVRSRPGRGSCFEVELPVTTAGPATSGTCQSPMSISPPDGRHTGATNSILGHRKCDVNVT